MRRFLLGRWVFAYGDEEEPHENDRPLRPHPRRGACLQPRPNVVAECSAKRSISPRTLSHSGRHPWLRSALGADHARY